MPNLRLEDSHACSHHRYDRCHTAGTRRDAACHRGRDIAFVHRGLCPDPRGCRLRYGARWLYLVIGGGLPRCDARGGPHRTAILSDRASARLRGAHFVRAQGCNLRPPDDGRVALHVITGKTDAEQEGDGDFAPKAERYQRAQEYLHLMKRTWASDGSVRLRGSVLSGFAAPTRMYARCRRRIR